MTIHRHTSLGMVTHEDERKGERRKEQRRLNSDEVEHLSKIYAEATGYYVEFHRGLKSVSSDKIRTGIRAVLAALSHTGGSK